MFIYDFESKLLKGVIEGTTIGRRKGDTRSLERARIWLRS